MEVRYDIEGLKLPEIQQSSSIQEVFAEYRAGSGQGCADIPTEEVIAPVPSDEWEALNDE